MSRRPRVRIAFWRASLGRSARENARYASIIFYHNKEQKRLAQESKERQEQRLGKTLYTEILPAGFFYLAEDYHQKYCLQKDSDLMRELRAYYPDFWDFVDSTVAARLNGYAGFNGTRAQLEAELAGYGLSPQAGENPPQRVRK